MHRLIAAILIALLAAPAFAADMPKTDEERTLYAIGMILFRQLSVFNLTPAELEMVKQGLMDAGSGKNSAVEVSAYNDKVKEFYLARRQAEGKKLADINKGFIDKAAAEKGAVKTGSGLVYLSLKDGSGAGPSPTATVKVNYRGMFPDGREFATSYKRGEPVELKMDGVIKCWNEGLQKMMPGGKAKLVCPPDLAYGVAGAGDFILPNATLVFEVELLEVKN